MPEELIYRRTCGVDLLQEMADYFPTDLGRPGRIAGAMARNIANDAYGLGSSIASKVWGAVTGGATALEERISAALHDPRLAEIGRTIAEHYQDGKEAIVQRGRSLVAGSQEYLEELAQRKPYVAGFWDGLINSQFATDFNRRPRSQVYQIGKMNGAGVGFGLDALALWHKKFAVLAVPVSLRLAKFFVNHYRQAAQEVALQPA